MCEFVLIFISRPNSIVYYDHIMYNHYVNIPGLACTSAAGRLIRIHIIPWAAPLSYKVRVCLHGFCHLFGDLINECVKGLLHIDIIFGAGLEVLYSKRVGQLFCILLANSSAIREVRFVANQDYSGILPREVSDGGGPVCVCVDIW